MSFTDLSSALQKSMEGASTAKRQAGYNWAVSQYPDDNGLVAFASLIFFGDTVPAQAYLANKTSAPPAA